MNSIDTKSIPVAHRTMINWDSTFEIALLKTSCHNYDDAESEPSQQFLMQDYSNVEKITLLNYYVAKELVSLIAEIKQLLSQAPKPKPSREFYDLPEAAEYLGIGKSTLRKALSGGDIICDRVGRKLRFTKSQLDKYIRRGKSDAEIDTEVENAILNNKRKRK